MNPGNTKSIVLLMTILCCSAWGDFASAQSDSTKGINGRSIPSDTTDQPYTFMMVGHAYGAQNSSPQPAASLLGSIDLVNDHNPKFMILLGDIMQQCGPHQGELLQDRLLAKYPFPVFNAPGNHDAANRDYYHKTFGPGYQQFQYQSELFIILDTEVEGGRLGDEQLQFLSQAIQAAADNPQIKNIIIAMHRLLWAISRPPYDQLIDHTNGPFCHPPELQVYKQKILPKLRTLKDKNIYIISGDVGLPRSLPAFYHRDETDGITYMAVGISDQPNDAMLRATVTRGQVAFDLIALNQTDLQPLEQWSLAYWNQHFTVEPKPSRGAADKLLAILRRKTFWMGTFLGGFAVLLVGLVFKKAAGPAVLK